jgi:hypothetical protein
MCSNLVHINLLEARCGKRVVFGVEMGGFWLKSEDFRPKAVENLGVMFTNEYMGLNCISCIPCKLLCLLCPDGGLFEGGGVGYLMV